MGDDEIGRGKPEFLTQGGLFGRGKRTEDREVARVVDASDVGGGNALLGEPPGGGLCAGDNELGPAPGGEVDAVDEAPERGLPPLEVHGDKHVANGDGKFSAEEEADDGEGEREGFVDVDQVDAMETGMEGHEWNGDEPENVFPQLVAHGIAVNAARNLMEMNEVPEGVRNGFGRAHAIEVDFCNGGEEFENAREGRKHVRMLLETISEPEGYFGALGHDFSRWGWQGRRENGRSNVTGEVWRKGKVEANEKTVLSPGASGLFSQEETPGLCAAVSCHIATSASETAPGRPFR